MVLRQFWAWQWINSWPDQKSPVSFAVEDTWYMVTNQPSLSLQVSIDLGKAVAWCSWEQALYDWSLPRQQSSLALLTTALTSTHLRNEDSGVLHRWEAAVLSSSYILCLLHIINFVHLIRMSIGLCSQRIKFCIWVIEIIRASMVSELLWAPDGTNIKFQSKCHNGEFKYIWASDHIQL